ncbi:MAG: FGGY family carbohydrate kinase [Oscillospiraceae bacterium]|nr:FGGY family carbohydrate kinase [Oscillospiraceae bacterium]
MAIFLGIDAGTTNLKAVLAGDDGSIIGSACVPSNVLTPFAGASEMDMDNLWESICALTRQLRRQNPKAMDAVEGMGVSAQGDGLWPVGADWRPVGNAILWNDTRTGGLSGIDSEGLDQLLVSNCSTAMFAGAMPMILKWIQQNQPERLAKIRWVVRCKDWLNLKFTGNLVSDYTDYSTCGINILTKKHVEEIYDFLGIPQVKGMLPTLVASTDVIGKVSAQAAVCSGIPAGIPVIAGALDVSASALGAGLISPGDGCIVLGTTMCSYVLIDKGQVDVSNRIGSTLCSILPDKYIRLMAALNGQSTIDWAKSILAPELSFGQLERELSSVPSGSRGVIYHPYLGGERAPFRNSFACGGFYGLTARHTRFDMMRAVYEGMVLSLKDCHRSLPPTRDIYIAGGGAVSDFTCALVASALKRPVLLPGCGNLTEHGIISTVKIGLGGKVHCLNSQPTKKFKPDAEQCERLDEIYKEFVSLRCAIEPHWNQRKANGGSQH